MIRRFVNIVAENYKSMAGTYSVYRLDVAKHLFYPSRDDAQAMPLVAESQDATAAAGDEPPMVEELPPPATTWHCSKLEYCGLVSPCISDGRILCTDEVGNTLLYNAESNVTTIMPCINEFKGPVSVSASVPRASGKEEDLYMMHGGLEPRFSVLKFGKSRRFSIWDVWHWQSLPPPPLVYKQPTISSYTIMDGGRAICVSSVAEGIRGGTYFFDTVCCEWRHAADWVLPFDGRAVYVPVLKLRLGFSLCRPCHLCATSGLSGVLMDQQPPSQIIWQNHTPEEWVATSLNLVNLGSRRFAVAKVFKVRRNKGESGFFSNKDVVEEDEFLVLTGVELVHNGSSDDNNLQGVQMLKHKSIGYMCVNNTIHCVL